MALGNPTSWREDLQKKEGEGKKQPQKSKIEIIKSSVNDAETRIKIYLKTDPKFANELVIPISHLIISLAMSTFKTTPNAGFFVGGGHSIEQRWPVSVNRSPLHHGGSCGMWSILYLFLRVLMVQFNSIRLQNVFTKLTDEADYECLYKAPHKYPNNLNFPRPMDDEKESPTHSVEAFCSGDIGRVFWFALFKAFQACVGTQPASPRFFFQCAGDADPNPGVLFINYFCVIRDLLPKDVTKHLGCESSEMPQEFYPIDERDDLVVRRWAELFLQENPGGKKGLERIINLGSDILNDPANQKIRTIRLKNKFFKDEIGSLKHSKSLMKAVGFTLETRGIPGVCQHLGFQEEVFYMADENVELERSMPILKKVLVERDDLVVRRWAELFLQENPGGKKGLERIINLGSDILNDPANQKIRTIRLKNKFFKDEIGSLKHSKSLMKAVGFTLETRGIPGVCQHLGCQEEVFYMADENVELERSMPILKKVLVEYL